MVRLPLDCQAHLRESLPSAAITMSTKLTTARCATTGDSWPELLGVLFQLSQAPEGEKRENAYRVFATTPSIIEKQHEETVMQAFQKGFKDEAVMV